MAQHEARILVRPSEDGKKEISFVDPKTGHEVRTKHYINPGEVDKEVRSLKSKLEQAGNHVTFKEM